MEPVTTGPSIVMLSQTAEIDQMKPIALRDVTVMSSSVPMGNVSHGPIPVTMTMTVEMRVTSRTVPIQHAEGISSLVQVGAAFTRAGFVMEMMTVKTMRMREDVNHQIGSAIQENGLVLPLGYVSLLKNCVMELQTVLQVTMKPTLQQAETAVL